jgi:Cu(I)/Ag(I) efflux system periplasmic protein CusF
MRIVHVLAAAALGLSATPFAQTEHAAHHAPAASASAAAAAPATAQVDGEVRKIDKEQGKLTLRHGPIQNLDMPGMTMVFKAADPAMLDQVKVGDKVKFAAENRNGALTVTAIKPAP